MRTAIALLSLIVFSVAQSNTNCTRQQVSDCINNANTLPICADGTKPVFQPRACCYDCRIGRVTPPDPTGCNIDLETIRQCAPKELPVRTNGCPSCRPINGVPDSPDCTKADFQACETLIPTLPACSDSLPLEREDCCINCRPVSQPPCDRTQIANCIAGFEQLRECSAGESPAFDRNACCRTCKRPIPAIPDRPDAQGRCTKDQYLRCLSTLDTCKPGESPFRNETNHCCPSCKRPESNCARETVVACLRNQRPCVAGEVPSRVAGECCETCKKARPTCSPACAANEVCVQRRTGPTCVRTRRLVYALVSSLSEEDLRSLIREIVQRFCERNENKRICLQFGQSPEEWDDILLAIVVRIINSRKEIDIPELNSAKRQTAASFADLVETALADQIANGGFQFVAEGASMESSMGSGAVALTASLLFTVILSLF